MPIAILKVRYDQPLKTEDDMTNELKQILVEKEFHRYFNDLTIYSHNAKGVSATMKHKTTLRIIGLSLLVVLGIAIALVFYLPNLLIGTVGLLYPIGLFASLLLSFYLIILSIRTDKNEEWSE